MKNINIRAIPVHEHRYPTLGDYWTSPDGTEEIRTTDLPDWRMSFLVALHELVESALCHARGISEPDIKAFDEKFEAAGKEGEPGDDREAPYYKEHQFALALEALVCQELGLSWQEYDTALAGLYSHRSPAP